MPHETVNRGWTFGVKFRPGLDTKLLNTQASHDRWTYNQLLEVFRSEYKLQGWVNCTRGRIGKWYTEMRKQHPFLRQTVSRVSRDKLFELGRHYAQHVETERLKAAGEKPETEFGEPHFKRYSDNISIPLTISHDGTVGSARFTGERTIRITRLGDIHLSRTFPVPNYRPKKATLYQTTDKKWRIGIVYGVEVERPVVVEPKVVGLDRNIGNVATPDMVIEPPMRVGKRLENLDRTIRHPQRVMNRRHKPDHKTRTPGSNRYERARVRHARRQREAANIRNNMVYKMANVVVGMGVTHAVVEKLLPKNMTKSARGTKEKPGKNVKQKSGLNRSIMQQGWGRLVVVLAYMLAGGVIQVNPAYTSQTCSWCLHGAAESRLGRLFRCVSCGFVHHADCNAGCNIENRGLKILGLESRFIRSLASPLPTRVGTAQGMGCLDVEGGRTVGIAGGAHPVKRQAWTGVESAVSNGTRVVRLWDDV